MGGRMAQAVLLVGGALIALSVIGLLADPEEPGRDVELRLAGGGEIAKGTRALVLAAGEDGETREFLLWPKQRRDGSIDLRLPLASSVALTEIALVLDGRVLWQTPPFLHTPLPETKEPPAPLDLIADPAGLLPLIGNRLHCPDAAVREVALERQPGSADIIATLDGQAHPLLPAGEGWTAGGIRLAPDADGFVVRGADGGATFCLPGLPTDLRPARVSGPSWTLILHGDVIGWAEADQPPALFQPSGTLSESSELSGGDLRLDRITFRTAGPQIAATPAACVDDATGRVLAWQVGVRFPDGRRHQGCAGAPANPPGGIYALDGLGHGTVVIGAELALHGPSFTARSACFAYQGRVLSGEDGVRLALDGREALTDCTGSGRRMAEELDEALTTGARLKIRGDGRITLWADRPAKGWVQPATTSINGQRAG